MELWIILVIVAQFLNAVVVVIDKYIVSTPELPRPSVYAFYVTLLSGIALFLLPLNFFPEAHNLGAIHWPGSLREGVYVLGLSLLAGFVYVIGIVSLFSALRRAEASDVVPVVGSASALVAFMMGTFIFNDPLPKNFYFGFGLLVVGSALISHYRFKWKGLMLVILAGLLIGANTMFVKLVFNATNFVDGYFWTRLGNVVAGSLLLAWPPVYYAVTRLERGPAVRASKLILLSKFVSGAAVALILVAISLGNLPIINAMQGLQFVFLLVLASGCTFWMPLCFSDAEGERKMFQKIVAVGIVVTGFLALFL